ncbi:glyoxylate reductase/hydroxypyruvate reductase-like [Corticium candelabrum]|uniref:glyoxylate reductase/hydroxypyruvate reductase-like n=1 Tax=Corticium candelabrum TaxID=121492 RepID=UPI002E25C86C|nr:glyoxylate reductase/hydroxypyruvate reductase-like [Corticium candelabrum]
MVKSSVLVLVSRLYSSFSWMSGVRRVLITRQVSVKALDIMRGPILGCESLDIDLIDSDEPPSRDVLLKRVAGKHGIYCLLTDRIDKELLDRAGKQLKVVSTMSVGYDHVDVQACKERGVVVGNTPGVLTDATADLTVALLLATSRRLLEGVEAVKDGSWGPWQPLWMCGSGLRGSTVGIVGLGRIGQAVAERIRPFGVSTILYTGRTAKQEAKKLGAQFVTFHELLAKSDFVLACCALTEKTRETFNANAFHLMKPSAVFVNTSRGGVVNQDHLYDALSNGQIRAAGLDVTTPEPLPTDHPLLSLKNCVILPHIGSAEMQTREEMAMLAARNLIAGVTDNNMPSPVHL